MVDYQRSIFYTVSMLRNLLFIMYSDSSSLWLSNADSMTEAVDLSTLWSKIRTILYATDGDVKELVQACEQFKTLFESQANFDGHVQTSISIIDVAVGFNEEFLRCIQSLLLPLTMNAAEGEIVKLFKYLVDRIYDLRFECKQATLLKIVFELMTTSRVILCFADSLYLLASLFKMQCMGFYYPNTLELFLEIFLRCFGLLIPIVGMPDDFFQILLRLLVVLQPRADKKKQSDRLIRVGRKVLHLYFPEDFQRGTNILLALIKVAQDDAERFKNGLNFNERCKYSRRIWRSVSLFNSMISIFSTEERQWNQHREFLQFLNTMVPMLTSIAVLMLHTSEGRRSAIVDLATRSIAQLHELLPAGDKSIFLKSIVELVLLFLDPNLTLLYLDIENILELIKQIIVHKDRCLFAVHISALIGPNGILPKLRFHQEATIVRLTMEIYRSLLLLKGDLCSIMSYRQHKITSVSIFNRMIVGELVVSLEMLACRGEVEGLDQQPLKIEFDNIWNGQLESDVQLSELKFILHFNASLLMLVCRSEAFRWISIANVPDIYSVLTGNSLLSSRWLTVFFPSVHYALLMLLRIYCTSYRHFSSDEILCMLRKQGTYNFHDYVEMIKQLLMNDEISVAVRKLLYEWINCIFSVVIKDDDFKSVYSADLVELASAAVTFHCDIIKCKDEFLCMLVQIFYSQFSYPKIVREKLYATILLASCYSCDECVSRGLQDILPEFSYDDPDERAIMLKMANNAQLSSNDQQPASSHLFATLMDFVLLNIDASELTIFHLKYFTDTAKFMIQYCSTRTEVEVLINEYPGSVWMMALTMLANCCIENRLKTIYGPKSSSILHLVEIALGSVTRVASSSDRTQLADQLSAERLHSVQCNFLLYFVEILYKMMYRCYTNIDPQTHVGLGSFYRINWNSFDAYFRKIRPLIVGLASRQGEYETVLMWISRLSSSDPILDETPPWGIYSFLLNVVDAYVMLQAAPSVIGFSHWIENKLKIDDQLIKICSHKASEQYEITASMLTDWVMSVESGNNSNPDVVDVLSIQIKYCYEEIVDCFVKLGDWSMAATWLKRGKQSCGVPVYKWQPLVDYIERMANLAANLEKREAKIYGGDGDADQQQLVKKRPTDYRNFLCYVDCTFLNIMENNEFGSDGMEEKLHILLQDLETRRFLCSTYMKPLSLCKDYEIRLDIIKVLENACRWKNWILGPVDTSQLRIDQLTVMYSIFCMTNVLPCGREVCLSDFCTSFAKRARKTGNLNLCLRIWRRHFGCNSTAELCSFLLVLIARYSQALDCAVEVAKLLWEQGRGTGCDQRVDSALKFLTQAVAVAVWANIPSTDGSTKSTPTTADGDDDRDDDDDYDDDDDNIPLAKGLVVLASWLGDVQFGKRHLPPPNNDDAEIAFQALFQSRLQQLQTEFDLNDNIADGVALSLAVQFCRTSVKAHHHYVGWLNSIIFSLVEEKEGFHAFRLSSKEKQFITSLLSAKSKVNLDNVLLLLETVRSEQNQLTWNVICPDVRKVCTSSFALEKLHEWWEARHGHLFNLYNTLCESYFVILRNNYPDDFITVDATIQIIRLVTSHYTDLKDCLHDGFSSVDVGCWKRRAVIPQLFAHLGHRNAGVRTLFADVLCSMAVEFPAMVIYPALAGLSGDGKHYRPAESQFRQNCCKRILDCLSELYPQMVRDTTEFVAELKRIILLHDEVWYSLLTSMRPEVARRLRDFYQNQEQQLPISDERKEQLKRGKTLLMKKMLHADLAEQTKNKSWLLKMEEISPKLAEMKDTMIPIPGVFENDQPVMIKSVVNIDYNVCFEKGKLLRVPETVPFRLTQNIVNALGISGVENSISQLNNLHGFRQKVDDAFSKPPQCFIELAVEFLRATGQTQKIQPYKNLESKIVPSFSVLRDLCNSLLDLVEAYRSAQLLVPAVDRKKHRLHVWLELLESVSKCSCDSGGGGLEANVQQTERLLEQIGQQQQRGGRTSPEQFYANACRTVRMFQSVLDNGEKMPTIRAGDLKKIFANTADMGPVFIASSETALVNWLASIANEMSRLEEGNCCTKADDQGNSAEQQARGMVSFGWMDIYLTVLKYLQSVRQLLVLPAFEKFSNQSILQRLDAGQRLFQCCVSLVEQISTFLVPTMYRVTVDNHAELSSWLMGVVDACATASTLSMDKAWQTLADEQLPVGMESLEADNFDSHHLLDQLQRINDELRVRKPIFSHRVGDEAMTVFRHCLDSFMAIKDHLKLLLDCLPPRGGSLPLPTVDYRWSIVLDFIYNYTMYRCASVAVSYAEGDQSASVSAVFVDLPDAVGTMIWKKLLLNSLPSALLNNVVDLVNNFRLSTPNDVPVSDAHPMVQQYQTDIRNFVQTVQIELTKDACEVLKNALVPLNGLVRSYAWHHEIVLKRAVDPLSSPSVVEPTCSTVLIGLNEHLDQLRNIVNELKESREELSIAAKDTISRLTWAAGANATWSSKLEEFERAKESDLGQFNIAVELCDRFILIVDSLYNYESLKLDSEQLVKLDNAMVENVKLYLKQLKRYMSIAAGMDPAEIELAKLKPSQEEHVTEKWLLSILADFEKRNSEANQALTKVQDEFFAKKTNFHAITESVRLLLNEHRKFTAEARAYMKHLAFSGDEIEAKLANFFLHLQKLHTLAFSDVLRTDITSLPDTWDFEATKVAFKRAAYLTNTIFDVLIDFVDPEAANSHSKARVCRLNYLILKFTVGNQSKSPNLILDVKSRSGKLNALALNAWKCVRAKLEGRNSNSEIPLSIADQVDVLISDATNLDNLALMYEGWTAWV
ncbi:Serine/threonine-protein kinase smg-1 [Trichinella sp. T6]|nr:Serine/threonine-protein kinase smg-1 [Trichinella sp. T6]